MNNKILLSAYYWYPYNNAGVFRWVNYSRYIDFDVLTCKRPLSKAKKDYSIRRNDYNKVWKFGWKFPAILWGFFAPFIALFIKKDIYIFTSPPESVFIGAYILQKLGKTVVIDIRDKPERESQYFKILLPIWNWFYKKLDNVVVAFQFFDESKPVIYHGYEDIKGTVFKGYYSERVSYSEWIYKLKQGYIPTQSKKPKGYTASSVQTYRHLNYPIDNKLHLEVLTHKLYSIKEAAVKYINYLNE